jgi:hypothetical protein
MTTVIYNDEFGVQYASYPLVQSMLRHEPTRTASLKEQGKDQINYPLSTDGWVSSIFIIRGRALDWMICPWLLVVGHATLYTVIHKLYFDSNTRRETHTWEIFFR